jgi:hypothetical protein
MRKTIITFAALALAAASLPALAASHQKMEKQFPSITELVTQYAVQISAASPLLITAGLTQIASPATFDAAGWTTKIQAAVGTSAFIQTVVDAVNAAIAARQAAVGPGYVTVGQDFYAAALAARKAAR